MRRGQNDRLPKTLTLALKLTLWLVLLPLLLALSGQARPQSVSSLENTQPSQIASTTIGPLAFDIEVVAPAEIQTFLQRHMELQRYRELTDLDAAELARLLTAAHSDIQNLLGTLGYFSAEVELAVQEKPQSSVARRHISITVKPGNPVKVTGITIEFTGAIAEDQTAQSQRRAITEGATLPSGATFTQSGWDGVKAQALRLLTSQHYPNGTIAQSRADIDPETQTAVLMLVLDSGPLFKLGALQITGLQRFDAQWVTRLARLKPGTPYDQGQILEAQQRLVDSGFFDSVFVTIDTEGDPDDASIKVQVREAKLQKIVLGIGANTDSGLRLSAEHTHHKVPGIDWRAVSKLSLDRTTQSLESELTSPRDETGTQWVTSALFQSQVSGSFNVDSQRYRVGRAQTGEDIDRNYYIQYDHAKKYGSGVATTANAVTVNYAWTQRKFDSLPFPSRGYGLGAELGGGITLENTRQPYLRAQVRWLSLWPLGDPLTDVSTRQRAGRVAMRAEGGMVLAREGVDLPVTQLFLTGGDTSVRGYGFRSIGAELAGDTTAPGRYLVSGSAEWQRPIFINDKATDWESTIFLDAGAVADSPANLNAKVGLGAGVRWKSPVGPLQIDLAYGLAVKELRLHLSVGFTF